MLAVEAQVGHTVEHGLDQLVGGGEIFKAMAGDGVVDTAVMGFKGQEIGDAHREELLENMGAVE